MNECFVSTQNARNTVGGWLKCRGVFRPCFRYKKHTKPPSWPINLNLCPASWLRVTARFSSWPPRGPPQPFSLPMHKSQACGMAYNII